MGGNSALQGKLASQLSSLLYATENIVNIYEPVKHAVVNPYFFDNYQITRDTPLPSGWDGSSHTHRITKFVDLPHKIMIRIVTQAATLTTSPDVVSRYVDHAGYMAIPEMWFTLTNNDVTQKFPIPYFKQTRDRLHPTARQYLDHQAEGMLSGVSSAISNTALISGHEFIIDIEVGEAQRGLENMQWLSVLSHELVLNYTIANEQNILYLPNGAGVGVGQISNITNKGALITSLTATMEAIHVTDKARAQINSLFSHPAGKFNFMMQGKQYYVDIPAAAPASGVYEWTIQGVNVPTRMLTLFFMSQYDCITPYVQTPFHCVGPSKVDGQGNTINFPTDIEIVGGAGSEVLVAKRSVNILRTWNNKHTFEGKEFGGYELDIPFAIKNPIEDNQISGAYDFGIWPNVTIKLYFSGVVASGGNGARLVAVFHTINFKHQIKGDVSAVFRI